MTTTTTTTVMMMLKLRMLSGLRSIAELVKKKKKELNRRREKKNRRNEVDSDSSQHAFWSCSLSLNFPFQAWRIRPEIECQSTQSNTNSIGLQPPEWWFTRLHDGHKSLFHSIRMEKTKIHTWKYIYFYFVSTGHSAFTSIVPVLFFLTACNIFCSLLLPCRTERIIMMFCVMPFTYGLYVCPVRCIHSTRKSGRIFSVELSLLRLLPLILLHHSNSLSTTAEAIAQLTSYPFSHRPSSHSCWTRTTYLPLPFYPCPIGLAKKWFNARMSKINMWGSNKSHNRASHSYRKLHEYVHEILYIYIRINKTGD